MGKKGVKNYTKPQKLVACINVRMREKVIKFPEEMHLSLPAKTPPTTIKQQNKRKETNADVSHINN